MEAELEELVSVALKAHHASDPSPAAGALGQPTEATAELVPHNEILHLSVGADGQAEVVNRVSLERFKLASGPEWSLEFDDEGFAIAVPDDSRPDVEPVALEEALRYQVYATPSGSEIIVSTKGANAGHKVFVPNFQSKFAEADITLKLGPSSSNHKFVGAVLKWPRQPGCMMLWSCRSVYEALGFDQVSKQWWRWTWAGFPRWRVYLATVGLQKHVVRSAHMEATGVCVHMGPLGVSRSTPSSQLGIATPRLGHTSPLGFGPSGGDRRRP